MPLKSCGRNKAQLGGSNRQRPWSRQRLSNRESHEGPWQPSRECLMDAKGVQQIEQMQVEHRDRAEHQIELLQRHDIVGKYVPKVNRQVVDC